MISSYGSDFEALPIKSFVMEAHGIEWDTEGRDGLDLPFQYRIETDEEMTEDEFVDFLTDKFELCIVDVQSITREVVVEGKGVRL